MIKPDAKLSIQRIPLEALQIKGHYDEPLSLERVAFYVKLYQDHPGEYAGLLYSVPSDTHQGIFVILDGRHRYLSSIIAQKEDALSIVEEAS